MTLPNFLIIGAAKAGTTALYHYLKQHPQVYMSATKEPNFFALEGEAVDFRGPGDQAGINRHSVTDITAYRAQFRPAAHQTALGEASTLYLYSPRAPQRIRHYVPDAKLILMLRHPAERAFSAYLHLVRDNREPCLDFAQALEAEETRIRDGWQHLWHYKQMGFYAAQLKRYFDTFDAGQIKVYLYDDFKAAPADILRDIFMFLGIDANFVPDTRTVKSNVSGIPKHRTWHTFLSKPNPVKSVFKMFLPYQLRRPLANRLREQNLVKPQLTPEVRQQLVALYREDILQLEDLLQRDLSKWLEPTSEQRSQEALVSAS